MSAYNRTTTTLTCHACERKITAHAAQGAFIELGAAFAAGTPVYTVGEALPETSVFTHHPLWRQFDSMQAALNALLA
jgi:hypothetical protein